MIKAKFGLELDKNKKGKQTKKEKEKDKYNEQEYCQAKRVKGQKKTTLISRNYECKIEEKTNHLVKYPPKIKSNGPKPK